MIEIISPSRLREELAFSSDVLVIDTRNAGDFEEWHIPGAINVPFSTGDELSEADLPEGFDEHDRVITICGKGISSHEVASHLEDAGASEVLVVDGGMEAWSREYDHTGVDFGDDVIVIQLQRVAKGCLTYVVGCRATNRAVVIDPFIHPAPIEEALETHDLEVEAVIDTHVHADHISGGPSLSQRLDVPYVTSARSGDRGLVHDHVGLEDGDTLTVGAIDITSMATPGHSTDIMSLVLEDLAVFTGDTLFTDAVGRTELESLDDAEDKARRLFHSLTEVLLYLPPETVVLPGHFEPSDETVRRPPEPRITTIGEAREQISLLTVDEETFVERIVDRSASRPPNYEEIIEINLGVRSLPDTDTLTELELGPNRCAAPA